VLACPYEKLLDRGGLLRVQRFGFPACFNTDLVPDFESARPFPLIQIVADNARVFYFQE
jgi:hypothetical protein